MDVAALLLDQTGSALRNAPPVSGLNADADSFGLVFEKERASEPTKPEEPAPTISSEPVALLPQPVFLPLSAPPAPPPEKFAPTRATLDLASPIAGVGARDSDNSGDHDQIVANGIESIQLDAETPSTDLKPASSVSAEASAAPNLEHRESLSVYAGGVFQRHVEASAQAADAAAPIPLRPAAYEASVAAAPANAVAPAIAEISFKTPRLVEIRLDPPELGAVTLAIEQRESGRVEAVVSADLPTTLDILRQHTDLLTQQLERSGFAGVNLSFAEGRREGSRLARDQHPDAEAERSDAHALPDPPPYSAALFARLDLVV